MKKMKNKIKRGIASLLAVVLVVGLLPIMPSNMTTTHAAESDTSAKTIAGLGTDIIADPISPETEGYDTTLGWQGSYVYFGTYNSKPVKYRVLDSETSVFGGTTMLLDCDSILWAGIVPSSDFDADSNVWVSDSESCDIREYLNGTFLTNNFSAAEQKAIAYSTKSDAGSTDGDGWSVLNYAPLSNDKIFFLDAKEATNTTYGYSNTESSATNREKTGGNAYWWLRSANSVDSDYAGIVYVDGDIYDDYVYNEGVGVSPALNLNLSSVLFSSVIPGTAGETGAEYKLTLLDSDMTIAGNGDVTRSGDTVTIPYTIGGTNSGNATQVSVLILDREYSADTKDEAEVLYYGALDTSAGNGTGTFTIPSDLLTKSCGSDYYAYIVAEDVNGTYETDYASEPVSITIPWGAPTVNTINIGTPGIVDPAKPNSTSDAWTGSYVYFGTYNGSLVKYRVLDSDTTVFGGTTMLLDCDSILWTGSDPSSAFDGDSNVWADSDIRTYLNGTFLTDNFTTLEQNAIAYSTKSAADSSDGDGRSVLSYASLSNDKIFFLDAKESTNTSYGYSNTYLNATNRVKTGGNAYWWLRSAFSNYSYNAGYVYSDGYIIINHVDFDDVGVSPALNVNLSSVLFSSASGTSKSSALTADSSEIPTTTGTEWKLTLSDTGKTIKVTDDEKVIKAADGTITVPYTYTDTATADTEKVNQISVMITDKSYTEGDAAILYYGALQGTDFTTTSGTGTFVMPSGLDGKVLGTDYHLYILAEHTTGTNATDYASEPVEITDIYDEIASVDVKVDAPVAKTALDTTATTSTEGLSATEYAVTWTADGETVTGDAEYNTTYTASVTLKANSTSAFASDVKATANGVTASLTENVDGTITVSYTFPVTEMGTISHEASGFYTTYDGIAHGITVNVSDPTDVTISYSTDEGDDKTYSETNPTFVDAGSYTVYYKIEKDNYTTVTGSKSVAIAPKELTITAADQTITYGDSIDKTKYSITGLVDGDSINAVTLTPSTSDATDNGTIAVSIDKIVNASGDDVTTNYDVTLTDGKLVIGKREIGVTASEQSIAWGNDISQTAYTITGEGLADGDYISLTLNASTTELTTEGTISVSDIKIMNGTGDEAVDVTANYEIAAPVSAKLTISHNQTLKPTKIEVTKTTTSYIAGQNLNIDDLTVTAYYEDGYSEAVTGYTTNASSIDMTKAGDKTLTISYTKNGGTVTKDVAITVSNGYAVNLPKEQVGYELTTDTTEVLWNGQVTLTFTLAAGYSKTDAFAVKVNGNEITLNADGTYTISNVLEDLTVTVEGVADVTAPSVEIKVKENSWTQFFNTGKFDIFFMEKQDVIITAEDINTGSGMDKVYYYISDEALSADEVKELTSWTEYTEKFSITPDDKYVVYAKAVDKAGNITYVCSDGMIVDGTAPIISGVTSGSIYEGDVTFSVTDTYFDNVYVDDTAVELVDGAYTIPADNKEHNIKATDKAGNETTVTITVNYGVLTVTDTDYSGVYDGQAHGITVSVANVNGATITYSTDGTEYSEINPQFTDVGTYTVYYKVTKDRYNTVTGEAVVSIKEKELSIVEYAITDGANGEYTLNSDEKIVITGNGEYSKFVGVKVDGAFIDEASYTVKSGSTIVTLKNAYLDTLSVGTHTFEMMWSDGSASTKFTVKEVESEDTTESTNTTESPDPEMPDTGDNSHMHLWLMLLIGCGLTAVGFWKKKKYIVEE